MIAPSIFIIPTSPMVARGAYSDEPVHSRGVKFSHLFEPPAHLNFSSNPDQLSQGLSNAEDAAPPDPPPFGGRRCAGTSHPGHSRERHPGQPRCHDLEVSLFAHGTIGGPMVHALVPLILGPPSGAHWHSIAPPWHLGCEESRAFDVCTGLVARAAITEIHAQKQGSSPENEEVNPNASGFHTALPMRCVTASSTLALTRISPHSRRPRWR